MITLPICDIGSRVDLAWNTVVKVLQPEDDLPIPNQIENLYLDFETTSEEADKSSINPHSEYIDDESMNLHRGCKICGVAFLFDNEPIPYYVPIRHAYLDQDGDYAYRTAINDIRNVSIQKVLDWLKKIFRITKNWKNHQIKYDYHVYYNETGNRPPCKLHCTVALSKLAAIQERLSYDLTEVLAVFGVDIRPYEDKIKLFLGKKYKDYGLIPPDQMATYAAVDVLSVRFLCRKLKENTTCPQRVIDLETNLIPGLIRMEQIGMHVDTTKLQKDWEDISVRQRKRISRIKKYGQFPEFIPNKKASLHEFFIEHLGWELDLTEKSKEQLKRNLIGPEDVTYSFGGSSIRKHIHKNPRVGASYLGYQEDEKLLTSYTIPYLESHTSSLELIHANINQQVRTGRMSVTKPGMQTLPELAKEYIIPYTEDYILVEFDLSQIEFRVICHYIENKAAIDAYNRDPTTDFHVWVQQMCGFTTRAPAKICNFLLGYGGGKKHFLEVMTDFFAESGDFSNKTARANEIYNKYHAALPELKPCSYRAGDVVKQRGFVRTLLGRERHIDREFFYKAFNSVCQGTAADIQKDITIRLQKYLGVDCLLHMLVHDSWLFSIRKDRVNDLIPEIKYEIERPLVDVNFSVPIVSAYGCSDKNWRFCK